MLFKPGLDGHQLGFAMGEAIAHLNHLVALGRMRMIEDRSGIRYRTIDKSEVMPALAPFRNPSPACGGEMDGWGRGGRHGGCRLRPARAEDSVSADRRSARAVPAARSGQARDRRPRSGRSISFGALEAAVTDIAAALKRNGVGRGRAGPAPLRRVPRKAPDLARGSGGSAPWSRRSISSSTKS